MMKVFVLVLIGLTLVCAQPPRPRRCMRTPSGWTGYWREANYDAQPGDISYRFADMSYDALGQRIKIYEHEERSGERPERIFKLYFYKEKIEYRVERDQCTKRAITEPFNPFGVLANAEFFGGDYLGAITSGLGVYVDHFGQRMQDGGQYFASFAPIGSTAAECVPLLEAFVNLRGPYSERMNVNYEFLNITAVTTWPTGAFEIPSNCLSD